MNRSFLRIIGVALAAGVLATVTAGFGADYLIIKKKDGTTQRVPLNFPPGQIEEFEVQSTPSGPAPTTTEPEEVAPQPGKGRIESETGQIQPEPEGPPSGAPFIFQESPQPVTKAPKKSPTGPRKPEAEAEAERSTGPRGPVAAAAPLTKGTFSVNVYKLPESIKALPDFSALAPVEVLSGDTINLNLPKGVNSLANLPQDTTGLGLRFVGMFEVSGQGIFKWRLHAKDGARMNIDDKTLIEMDGVHEPLSKSGFVQLAEGVHSIVVDSFNSTGSPVLELSVEPPIGEEHVFSISKGLVGWQEPKKPYDVLWGQVYFVPKGTYPKGPDLSRLTPIGRIIAPDLSIAGSEGFPGLPGRRDMVAIRYQGYFTVDGAGIFAFRLVSDGYAKLTIGKDEIVDVPAATKSSEPGKLGWAFLQQGNYPISVDYFHTRGNPTLKLLVTEPQKEEKIFTPAEPVVGFASDSGKLSLIPAFVYFLKPGTGRLPNFNKLSPAGMFFTQAIDYPIDRGTKIFPGVPQRDSWLGLRFYVKFSLSDQEAGTYKFRLVCRDGARLIIGKKIIINADGVGKRREGAGEIVLNAGSHEMFLDYFQTTGPDGLQLFITPPGGEEKIFAFK
jgi:hypothetical protein